LDDFILVEEYFSKPKSEDDELEIIGDSEKDELAQYRDYSKFANLNKIPSSNDQQKSKAELTKLATWKNLTLPDSRDKAKIKLKKLCR